jgi:hypothetical protein
MCSSDPSHSSGGHIVRPTSASFKDNRFVENPSSLEDLERRIAVLEADLEERKAENIRIGERWRDFALEWLGKPKLSAEGEA